MTIQRILRLGEPSLFQVAHPVSDFNTPELKALISDMFDTMAAQDGAGLAAPQIGVPLRVIVFGFDLNPRYADKAAIPKTVLINPEITVLQNDEEDAWEGCLSVPGMRGLVSRYSTIRYTGFDASGDPLAAEATGFLARVMQHECDHLDGILYTQRLTDPRKFGFTEELLNAGQISKTECTE